MTELDQQHGFESTQRTVTERFGAWVRESVMLKILTILILGLLLLAPMAMIGGLVNERESTRNAAVEEVSGKWGGAQTIAGPVLTVPYLVRTKPDSNRVRTDAYDAHFLPRDLRVEGAMKPEVRYRGMYRVILYSASLRMAGDFARPDFAKLGISESDVLWGDASLSVGVTDMRGIRDSIPVTWAGRQLVTEPGVRQTGVFDRGVSTAVPEPQGWSADSRRPFTVTITANGSRDLRFLPLGKQTTVRLTSAWRHPSFGGAFLPDKREISADGFSAEWKVLDLNRSYPMQWTGGHRQKYSSDFGVSLVQPADHFQKVTRATKYAALFVCLTFLAFLMVEVMRRRRVHPMQYLLVGLAIVLFYALLMGTAGLFVILGAVMFLTRKIDWYAVSLKPQAMRGPAVAGGR